MEPITAQTKRSETTYRLLAVAVVVWSFGWTYLCGRRGIFIFDQSIIFDAGWRILAGQTPYKDFQFGMTPLVPAIQAGFFSLFGVNWTAYVISAATFGAAAAACAMRMSRLLFGQERKTLALASGFLMGSFFQAIFGTLFFEQVAFYFCLLGMQLVLESLRFSNKTRFWFLAAAGVCGTLAFLSKQNAGALSLVLLGFLVIVAGLPRLGEIVKGVLAYGAGALSAGGLFVLWLFTCSDARQFAHFALEVPAKLRVGHSLDPRYLFLPEFLMNKGLLSTPTQSFVTPWCDAFALGAASLALAGILFEGDIRRRFFADARFRLAVALAAAIPFVTALFQSSTLQHAMNLLFFSGLALTLGYGLARELIATKTGGQWLAAMACLTGAFLLFDGLRCAWYRREHFVFSPKPVATTLKETPGLAGLQWLESTYLGGYAAMSDNPSLRIAAADVESVCQYLSAQRQPFFVLGDSKFLYGVTHTAPPPGLLYFQPNIFYTQADIPALDEATVKSLQSNNTRLIVREKYTLFNNPDHPGKPEDAFPTTLAWIADNFTPGPVFGNYEILLHK